MKYFKVVKDKELRAVTNWRRLRRYYEKAIQIIEFSNIPEPAFPNVDIPRNYSVLIKIKKLTTLVKKLLKFKK